MDENLGTLLRSLGAHLIESFAGHRFERLAQVGLYCGARWRSGSEEMWHQESEIANLRDATQTYTRENDEREACGVPLNEVNGGVVRRWKPHEGEVS